MSRGFLLATCLLGADAVALNQAPLPHLGALVPAPSLIQEYSASNKGFGFGSRAAPVFRAPANQAPVFRAPANQQMPAFPSFNAPSNNAMVEKTNQPATTDPAAPAAAPADPAAPAADPAAAEPAAAEPAAAAAPAASADLVPAKTEEPPPTQAVVLAPATIDFNIGPGGTPVSDANAVEPEYRNAQGHNVMLLVPGHLPLVLPYGTLITLPGDPSLAVATDTYGTVAPAAAEAGYGANAAAAALATPANDDTYEDIEAYAPVDQTATPSPEVGAITDGYGDPIEAPINSVQLETSAHTRSKQRGSLATEIADAIASLEL